MTATSAGRRRAANGCGCGCASASVGALRQRERSECRARVSIEMAQGASQRNSLARQCNGCGSHRAVANEWRVVGPCGAVWWGRQPMRVNHSRRSGGLVRTRRDRRAEWQRTTRREPFIDLSRGWDAQDAEREVYRAAPRWSEHRSAQNKPSQSQRAKRSKARNECETIGLASEMWKLMDLGKCQAKALNAARPV